MMLKTKDVDYIIASDTDSIYVNLGGLVQKYISETDKLKTRRILDKFCEDKIQPFINESYQELADYVNAYAQKMIMKREALADKAIWTAKKRYLMNVYNNEGVEYAKPKMKIMGLEAIKSSTPSACRQKIKEALEVILSKDQQSVNGLEKYSDNKSIYGSKTPIHVRGSLLFNHHIVKNDLTKKYEQIKEGEKIKFIYLREPNPIQSDVISFMSSIPKEFDLENYIDYNTMFDKSFVEPLKIVLDAINWKVEKTNSLEDFFS